MPRSLSLCRLGLEPLEDRTTPAAPALDNAAVVGNILLLTGSALPDGLALVPVPPGSVAVLADLSGDTVNDVILFTPGLVAALDGQTGRVLGLAADLNGDGFRDLQIFNSDGSTTLFDGRTGIVAIGDPPPPSTLPPAG
jgi:hypothetical protein